MNTYDDEHMFYDYTQHRYILTPEYIADKYGIQLNDILDASSDISPETLPERFLDRVSMEIYNACYQWSSDPRKTEYVLSFSDYRDCLMNAMGEYAYTLLLSNRDPSVFFQNSLQRSISLPPSVRAILLNGKALFRGTYTNIPQDYQDRKGIDY